MHDDSDRVDLRENQPLLCRQKGRFSTDIAKVPPAGPSLQIWSLLLVACARITGFDGTMQWDRWSSLRMIEHGR